MKTKTNRANPNQEEPRPDLHTLTVNSIRAHLRIAVQLAGETVSVTELLQEVINKEEEEQLPVIEVEEILLTPEMRQSLTTTVRRIP